MNIHFHLHYLQGGWSEYKDALDRICNGILSTYIILNMKTLMHFPHRAYRSAKCIMAKEFVDHARLKIKLKLIPNN